MEDQQEPKMFVVPLSRRDSGISWGFRLQGGKDFNTPLSVQVVQPKSVAERCGLKPGDGIIMINERNSDELTHEEAKMEIIRSCNDLKLTILRGAVRIWKPKVTKMSELKPDELKKIQTATGDEIMASQKTSLTKDHYDEPLNIGSSYNRSAKPFAGFGSKPQQPPPQQQQQQQPQYTSNYGGPQAQFTSQPQYSGPQAQFTSQPQYSGPQAQFTSQPQYGGGQPQYGGGQPQYGGGQPQYIETQPQVTRVIKPKYGGGPGLFGGGPPVYRQEPTSPKRAVPKVVHSQFNSPIGLYSANNIAESYAAQTEGINKQMQGLDVSSEPVGMRMTGTYQRLDSDQGSSPASPTFTPGDEVTPPTTDQSGDVNERLQPTDTTTNGPTYSLHATVDMVQTNSSVYKSDGQSAAPPSSGGFRSVSAPTGPPPGTVIQPKPEIPHCACCGNIISGVFVRVKGQTYNEKCFKCSKCGIPLKQRGYLMIEDQLFCENCAKKVAKPPGENMRVEGVVYN